MPRSFNPRRPEVSVKLCVKRHTAAMQTSPELALADSSDHRCPLDPPPAHVAQLDSLAVIGGKPAQGVSKEGQHLSHVQGFRALRAEVHGGGRCGCLPYRRHARLDP